MFSRFDRVPACDRQTDGQTDVQTISITCFSIADARKNCTALVPKIGKDVHAPRSYLLDVLSLPLQAGMKKYMFGLLKCKPALHV